MRYATHSVWIYSSCGQLQMSNGTLFLPHFALCPPLPFVPFYRFSPSLTNLTFRVLPHHQVLAELRASSEMLPPTAREFMGFDIGLIWW
jgi:hypothetical protein